MKTAENQQNSSTPQDAVAHSSNAQPAQSPTDKQFKKPHMKLFNCVMKPSLSLTSLPPQSPKEASDEMQQVERPYNSLKVKTSFIVKVNEFSQNFCLFFLEKARWRKRTLATIMGIASVNQHNNFAHGHKWRKKRK